MRDSASESLGSAALSIPPFRYRVMMMMMMTCTTDDLSDNQILLFCIFIVVPRNRLLIWTSESIRSFILNVYPFTDSGPLLSPSSLSIHVVFGHVVSGQDLLRQLEQVPVDKNSRPLEDVTIINCGELIRQVKGELIVY